MGASCITARAHVYAMMMDSPADDQIRLSPYHMDEENIRSVSSIWSSIISCLIPPQCGSGVKCPCHIERTNHLQSQPPPQRYLARQIKYWPKLLLCACESCVISSCLCRPGAKMPTLFKKMPRPHGNCPGASFHVSK